LQVTGSELQTLHLKVANVATANQVGCNAEVVLCHKASSFLFMSDFGNSKLAFCANLAR
jgi:hypothetical protein